MRMEFRGDMFFRFAQERNEKYVFRRAQNEIERAVMRVRAEKVQD